MTEENELRDADMDEREDGGDEGEQAEGGGGREEAKAGTELR